MRKYLLYRGYVMIFISKTLLALTILFSLIPLTCDGIDHQKFDNISSDSLDTYITKARSLWADGKSDLQLAVDLLSEVSINQAQPYYGLATDFYYWSLKNAGFQKEQGAISDELGRIIPLVPDSTKDKWRELYKNKDRQLLNELAGFWEIKDPYVSTKINERLLEHWQRINYTRKNFTKAQHPPYNTDDRGIFYVRLGAPQKITSKTIHLSRVIDPEGGVFYFELGNIVRSEIEIWEYPEFGDDFFLLFGERNGWGEYGLRRGVLELFDTNNLRVQLRNSGFMSDNVMKDFSSTVAQLGIFEKLAPYHPFFDNMYSRMRTSLSAYTMEDSTIDKYIKSTFYVEPLVYHRIYQNLASAPPSKTNTVLDNGNLSTQTGIYRFLSPNGKNQFIVAIQANSDAAHTKSYESLFLSNFISVYDNSWNQIAKIDDPTSVNEAILSRPSVYLLEEPLNKYKTYFSSELIDTTYNDIYIPGKINPKASAIVSTSGRKKLQFPPSFDKNDTLLISDVVLGLNQPTDNEARIPITPSLDHSYKPNTNLMVYFEAYNIPEGGYSFKYYFEEHRWLFGNKRVEEKPSVTIINDKVEGRNRQSFSISLSDLEKGTYDLVFEFKVIDQINPTINTKRIELEVIE